MVEKKKKDKVTPVRPAVKKAARTKQCVLVADDNKEILQVVRLLLEIKGYEVVTTHQNILTHIKKIHPNLLLLDVLMSGEDGRIITKTIKANKAFRDIPVILFSAKNNLAQVAKEAGADGFLEKPFESRNLYNIVVRHARSL